VVQRFTIHISDGDLQDLERRLAAARWPAGIADSGGLSRATLEPLVTSWRSGFGWRAAEAELNRHPHFTADVGGSRIHFVHLRSAREHASAVLLLHGWPGSFVELLQVGELLRSRHHVVIPSIPGFGFSSVPSTPGMSNRAAASVLARLMSELGYGRFAVHGGDIGAGIGSWMARDFAARMTALHLNYIPGSYAPAGELSDAERDFVQGRQAWFDSRGAYAHIHRTTPLTAAYALSDSPIGLAAWIVEKFELWADPASDISREVLLTNAALYWFTNTISSSMRFYLESARTPLSFRAGERIGVPTAVARFPHEMPFPPRTYVERGYNVVRWVEMPRGGHFAALEEPELLARDIGEALAALVSTHDEGGSTHHSAPNATS
jgi:pimeloyl-ACP methyl ester carboxylesterase